MALPKLGTPKYTMVLPSTDKVIEYRPYTVREEKALVLAMESEDQGMMLRSIRDLINECSFGKVDAYNLTMFDFELLFLKLRAKSVGETSNVIIPCSHCNESNDVAINLDDVNVIGRVEHNMKVMLTDDLGVTLSYPKVQSVAQEVEGMGKEKSEYETTVGLISACVDTIFDTEQVYVKDDHSPKEWREFIESLSTAQFKKITDKFENVPTVKHDVQFKCSSCKKDNTLTLEGLQSFF